MAGDLNGRCQAGKCSGSAGALTHASSSLFPLPVLSTPLQSCLSRDFGTTLPHCIDSSYHLSPFLQVTNSSTSYLTLLDSTSALLIQSLLARQSLSPLSGPTTLVLPTSPKPTRVEVTINKPVSMPQLQRLKRQFTQLNARAGKEFGQEAIASMFADYVEGQLR
jgi:hypothetical protein